MRSSTYSDTTIRPPRTSFIIRPNTLLGRIVPVLMATFIALGSRLVLTQVCPFIIHELGMSFIGRIYRAIFLFVFTLVSGLYLWIYLQPGCHSSPPSHIPDAIQRKLIVYEASDILGTPSICQLCRGRMRPLRARHCLDCGTCKTGFDHHCVWFSTCITATTTLKPFIQILILAPLLLILGLLPLIPITHSQLLDVVQLTWADGQSGDFLRTIWWARWWGWAGGPGWRYGGALILGYWNYHWLRDQHDPTPNSKSSGVAYSSLRQPTLSSLLICMAAFFVLLVTTALLAITIRQTILHGRHTIDVERFRRWRPGNCDEPTGWDPRIKIWVPDQAGIGGGKVVWLEPGEDVFDNGPVRNWQALMGTRMFEWFVPWPPSLSGALRSTGVEWPISAHWLETLREREPCQNLVF